MVAVTGRVPNMINGVSQQSAALRLPSQGELSDNYYPVIVDGLVPRPRTDFLAKLNTTLPAGTFTHIILRDETEKYILAIKPDGTVQVWDFDGNEKTVTNNGEDYLADMVNPKDELRALTVADHTFLVNKTVEVAAGSDTEDTRPHEALIGVLAGNYAKTYRIFIDGDEVTQYTTPNGEDTTHAIWIDTVQIANQLYIGLNTGNSGASFPGTGASQTGDGGYNTSPWALGRYHSTIYLRNTDVDFTLSVEDGFSGRAMKEAKGTIQKFSDLPQYGPDGVVMKVAGDNTTGFDDYWVKFNKTNDANGFGVWKECVAPGAVLGLDPDTMPHTLVRNEDGTFTFGPEEWGERRCGDAETVPDPSFVGSTIEEVFFHRNRFGVLTSENYVLSEHGSFFNFFRTTLTALLDTDPIDGAASHIKVSLLRHAVPYSEALLLFSDETQFRLDGNELLTPKTVNAKPLSELAVNHAIRPVTAGTSVYFVSEGEAFAALTEYFIDKQVQSADDENVSSHAPSYIPAGVHRLIASPNLDLVAVATEGDPDAVYLYKYHWNGQEKLQSAWSRWTFPRVDAILDMAFDKKNIILLVDRDGDVCIERLNAEQGTNDTGSEYRMGLDQSVILDDGVYTALTDTTIFTLPYDAPETLKAVTAPGGLTVAGVELTIASIDADEVTFEGDLSGDVVRFGTEFEARYRFSTQYYRSQEGQAFQDGRTQLLSMAVNFDKTAYFRVEVTPDGRPMRTYPFTGRVIGDPNNLADAIILAKGRFSFPVRSRHDRVQIDVVNDTWRPCAFTSATWRGTFNPTSRQL